MCWENGESNLIKTGRSDATEKRGSAVWSHIIEVWVVVEIVGVCVFNKHGCILTTAQDFLPLAIN